MLLSVTVLQRFSLSLGATQVEASFFVVPPLILFLIATNNVRVDKWRLLAGSAAMTLLAVAVVFSDRLVSLTSFLYLIAIYSCFVGVLPMQSDRLRDHLGPFRTLMFGLALCGIGQFAAQLVVPGTRLFTFDGLVPEFLLLDGYNTVIPLYFGSAMYKCNGLFFLEPSIFSQYIALAVLIELAFFKITPRTIVLGIAGTLTFSGTGLGLLIVFGVIALVQRRRFAWLALGAAAVPIFLSQPWVQLVFTDRIAEFGTRTTSGFARFISPFWLIRDSLLDDPLRFFFGRGPGTTHELIGQVAHDYEAYDPTWAKLLLEYGLLGFIAFLAFIAICLFGRSHSRTLAAAVLFSYLFLGGVLIQPYFVFVALVLFVLPAQAQPRADLRYASEPKF